MSFFLIEKPKLVRMSNNPIEILKLKRWTNSPEDFFICFPELKLNYQPNSISIFLLEKPKLMRMTNNPLEIPKLERQTNSPEESFVYFSYLENIYESNISNCFFDNDNNISK